MADQRGHTHSQPNGQSSGASPRPAPPRPQASIPRPPQQSPRPPQQSPRPGQQSPRPGQQSPRPGQQSPRPAQQSPRCARPRTQAGGSCPRRDSGLLRAQTEELFEQIACCQNKRLDDQRASISQFPELSLSMPSLGHRCGACTPQGPGEDFFNMLIKYQSSRIEDQRCDLPDVDSSDDASEGDEEEDLFCLIERVQARRMDEQRALMDADEQQGGDTEPEAEPATGPC